MIKEVILNVSKLNEAIIENIAQSNSSQHSSDMDSSFSTDSESMSPSSSHFSSSPSSHQTVLKAQKPKEVKPRRTYTKKANKKEAMLNSSRVMLCMFVMSIMFFNPFNLIISSSSDANSNKMSSIITALHGNGRVLNSIDPNEDINENVSSMSYINLQSILSWTLNIILVLFVLFRIYIDGEPYVDPEVIHDDSLWVNYQKASRNFERKNYQEALNYCEKSLKELGLNTVRTHFELVTGIMWQIIRSILDRLYIGILFYKLKNRSNKSMNIKAYKLAGLFYYEMHKFAYLNMRSEKDLIPKATTINTGDVNHASSTSLINAPFYSNLFGVYYLLSSFNMTQVYFKNLPKNDQRDLFNLSEIYFSIFLYLKFFMPGKLISNLIESYLINCKLSKLNDLNENNSSVLSASPKTSDDEELLEEKQFCKLEKLKSLSNRKLFLNFLNEFGAYSISDFDNINTSDEDLLKKRQVILNLISYKRKIFTTSFLHDADDKLSHFNLNNFDDDSNMNNLGTNCPKITCTNAVACDFILRKFQDYALFKMTNRIIDNTANVVKIEQIVKSEQHVSYDALSLTDQFKLPCELDEESKELAEIEQAKFKEIYSVYKENLEYFSTSKSKTKTNASNQNVRETQSCLLKFLLMMNYWKLRKFDYKTGIQNLNYPSKKLAFIFLINLTLDLTLIERTFDKIKK